ncbi:hypothetical protein VTO42DRAFT_8415 [Malbranchea cinnamomea]
MGGIQVDLLITHATVVTASDVLQDVDIAISGTKVLLLGKGLSSIFNPITSINAYGAYVTPGGIDSHVHIGDGFVPEGDTFETATRSAIAGGTTTILSFAQQNRNDETILPIIDAYHELAKGNAYCDYGFHLMIANPSPKVVKEELPLAVEGGITSVKFFMTYEPMKLPDKLILDLMLATRQLGMTTMVHAENGDVIDWIATKLEEQRLTDPYYHAVSRPKLAEDEATYRAISLAELMDVPILIVHMSSKIAADHVRRAQARLLPVHAETCPQYLYFTSEKLKGEGFEGAKCVCSPPLRDNQMDLDAIWQGLSNGTFTTFSSDHAPSRYDHPDGKKSGLVDGTASFRKIPNGLPGVETRLPSLFSGVLAGRLTIQKFVELTSSNPAKLYGLGEKKGIIAPGFDADLVIWYPTEKQATEGDYESYPTITPFKLTNEMLHHRIDYTPFEGMEFTNWPRYTILRGKVVWDRNNGGIVGQKGNGHFLKRGFSTLSKPREIFVNEFRPHG